MEKLSPALKAAFLAGLVEGVAVARYDVLMGEADPASLLRAILCILGFVAVQLVVWTAAALPPIITLPVRSS